MRRASGAEAIEKRFLSWNRRGERVVSERMARVKVRVDKVRPMMVRYWKCQPNEALMWLGLLIR